MKFFLKFESNRQNTEGSEKFLIRCRYLVQIFFRPLKVFRRVDVEGFHFGPERGMQYQIRVSIHHGSAADVSVQAAQLTG